MKGHLLAPLLGALLCSPAHALWPANGNIGVFGDAVGTQLCVQAAPLVPATFCVFAAIYGAAGGRSSVRSCSSESVAPTPLP